MTSVACESGELVVSIADSRDRQHPYAVAPTGLRLGEDFAAVLTRRDGERPAAYRVSHGGLNGWNCTCPDAKYGAPKRRVACKHVAAALDLIRSSEVIMTAKGNPPNGACVAAPERPADGAAQQAKAPPPAAPGVYRAMHRVQAELARLGLAKSHDNKMQGFKFRGIDDVMNVLSPLLADAGLLIIPRVASSSASERTSSKGAALRYVTVRVEYDFVCVHDGSRHVAVMDGEAMDSGDKATGKAMSMAYKTLCFEAFCIPTQGTPDADAETHEVAPGHQPTAAVFVGGADHGAPLPHPEPKQETKAQALLGFDAKLAGWGFSRKGELVGAVVKALAPTFGHDPEGWSDVAWKSAHEATRGWLATQKLRAVAEAAKLIDQADCNVEDVFAHVGSDGIGLADMSERQMGQALAYLRGLRAGPPA